MVIEVPVCRHCLLNQNEESWLDCWLRVVEVIARSIVDQELCAKLMEVASVLLKNFIHCSSWLRICLVWDERALKPPCSNIEKSRT